MFKEICNDLANLLEEKDYAYKGSAHKQYEKYGLLYPIMRLQEKLDRLERLHEVNQYTIVQESVDDTLKDIAGYAILTLHAREVLKNANRCDTTDDSDCKDSGLRSTFSRSV